ncbi:GTP:AMP phosphotransferase AK3, mitochondrial isoform X1 [Belonocnema kinseyi]|uniref:GTP:AMP phosphotransferase AK3, mitochondrial isoform X1 n=1 Tax=Belonocnema kinseyi TaxID=2817044 RepID=UPI00143D969A|nr:GTP:AMP phosphotransferase AK3, mitochondrial isoform X1 [Belonocnema kinseyi]
MVVLSTCCKKAAAFRAVILGAPASGKGTVSSRIIKNFNVAHISSGDKLRLNVAAGTGLGKEVKQFLDSGSLVPDDVMISLISKEIESVGNQNWLLDGFPRTLEQAEKLQKVHPVSLVLNLIVPHSVILERVKSRWIHLPSGRVYNIGFNDPKVPGKDDITGEPLSQRLDDRPEVVKKRLDDYARMTDPVINYYRKNGILHDFSGNTTDAMWPHIKECVGQLIKT